MATDFAALDALYPLPPDELPRQWVLTREPGEVPTAWQRRSSDGWHLTSHPDAQVSELRAADGALLGWVIEPLAYLSASGDAMVRDTLTLPIPADAPPSQVERALYGRDDCGQSGGDGLEGTWVAVVFGGAAAQRFGRVYLGAIHSVVYSPQHRSVATTHNLIPGLRRDLALSGAFDPLATNSYFTFGLTAFHGVERLLPNHYLDLETFAPVRHWPLAPPQPLPTGEHGAAAIVHHARRLLEVLRTENENFHVFLSAGRDSRAILSLLRPLVAADRVKVHLATTAAAEMKYLTDFQGARRLARIANLPHEVTWRRQHRTDARDVMRRFVRIGESKSGPILSSPALSNPRPKEPGFRLAGMAGETARAFYWGKRRFTREEITPRFLIEQMGSPMTDAVVRAAEAWLAALPPGLPGSAADVLDLAYVEQRMGCWESSTRYLFPGRPRSTSPMAAAFNVEMMLRLPEDYRAAKLLQRDMVALGWPELLAVPFNTPTGALRLLRDAGRLQGRLRGKLGRVRRRVFGFPSVTSERRFEPPPPKATV